MGRQQSLGCPWWTIREVWLQLLLSSLEFMQLDEMVRGWTAT
ncbi:MAG: hypothetical protein KatS3mg011_1747 [Acidimicrobiia bacterium]|nr:MAG: hypothetical protein KatS3mg011_1747 [Acidimicrobiia bacterium]